MSSTKKLKVSVYPSRPSAVGGGSATLSSSGPPAPDASVPPHTTTNTLAPSGISAMSTMPSFAVNERVLCYHGPLFYEAKVLKHFDGTGQSPTGEPGPHYMVHYKGWKATWDEWVPVRRLMKYSDEKVMLQKRAAAEQKAEAAASAAAAKREKEDKSKSAASASGSASARGGSISAAARKEGSRGTKRARDDDDGLRKPEMRYDIPDILKVKLVDDWEYITRDNQLLPLPRTPNVADTLNNFAAWASQQPALSKLPRSAQLLPTITSGLKLYFDRALGQNLLYRFERMQYAKVRKEYVTGTKVGIGMQREMSTIYGPEHLLRMLVHLPQMVSQSKMDPDSVNILTDYVVWLLKYLVQERDKLFVKQYETAPSSYTNTMLNT